MLVLQNIAGMSGPYTYGRSVQMNYLNTPKSSPVPHSTIFFTSDKLRTFKTTDPGDSGPLSPIHTADADKTTHSVN